MNPASNKNGEANDATSIEHTLQQADFELRKLEDGRWRLRVNTRHALYWMKSADIQHDGGELHLNLMSANDLLRQARLHGLKTEYIGPMGRSII